MNIIAQVLAAAEKHKSSAAVESMVTRITGLQTLIKVENANKMKSPALIGYLLGAMGEDGYTEMHSIKPEMILGDLNQAQRIREVTIVTECLMAVLQDLGEEFDY